jgi:predicted metal-binding membrane protein
MSTISAPAAPPVEHDHDHGAAGGWRLRMAQLNASPMSRARAGILVGLLALTGGSWAFLIALQHDHRHATTATMGMSAGLFLAVWVAMMIATMFPAVAPMVLMFARIGASKRTAGQPSVPVRLFLAGYLLVWSALGVLAYGLASGAEALAVRVHLIADNAPRIGGALIVVAGAYQFSKLKDRCLTECRSPLAFVMQHWRDGRAGAVRMGIHHGWHCAGCCWALMAMLFPIGMMNIAALAAVTAFIYAEKVLPGATVLRYAAGVALIMFGLAVMVEPSLLPGTFAHQSHRMSGM